MCLFFSLGRVFSLSFYSGKCESPIGTCIIDDFGFQTSETAAIWLEFEHFERSIFEIGGFHLNYPGYLKGLSYLSRYSSHRFLRRNCPWLIASILGKYGEEDARNTTYPLKKPIYFYIIIYIYRQQCLNRISTTHPILGHRHADLPEAEFSDLSGLAGASRDRGAGSPGSPEGCFWGPCQL